MERSKPGTKEKAVLTVYHAQTNQNAILFHEILLFYYFIISWDMEKIAI